LAVTVLAPANPRTSACALQHAGNKAQSATACLIQGWHEVDELAGHVVDALTGYVRLARVSVGPHGGAEDSNAIGVVGRDLARARSSPGWLRSLLAGCEGGVSLIDKGHRKCLLLTLVDASGAWLSERPPVAHAGGRIV
jgi:hypothetical protein